MKQKILPLLGVLGAMVLLLWQSAPAAAAVRQGLDLCAQSVVPALFPFFVLSSLFLTMGYGDLLSLTLAPLMKRLFHINAAGGSAFFLGILGGYPVGVRTVAQLYRSGRCSRREAETLLTFCNNAGPAFAVGFVGLGRFGDLRIGLYLYLLHVAAAVITGILLRPSRSPSRSTSPSAPPPAFPSALIDSVQTAFSGILQVCGFVIFSFVALQLLNTLLPLRHPLLTAFVELTCGILQLSGGREDFWIAAAALSWGGLSVLGQTAAALMGTDLSLTSYLRGKLLQTTLSLLLAIPTGSLLFP